MLHERLAANQPGHHLRPLDPRVARVGEEALHLGCRGGHAGQIERDAPEELVVAADLRWLDLHRLPLAGNEGVDRSPGLGLRPLKSGAIPHHRERDGGVGAFIADEDRCLTAAEGRHEPLPIGAGDLAIATVEECLAGNVARSPVGIAGDNAELLPAPRCLDHGRGREDCDPDDPRRGGIELRPLLDPAAHNLVRGIIGAGELATGVGDRRRRLEEHQAVVGAGEIHAPGAVIIGEGADVVDRIVAAQGKLEAVLPLRRPVAGPLVAAHLGQERIDIADEVDVGDVFRPRDRHRDLFDHNAWAARLAMNDPQARGAVGERANKPPGAD